MIKNMRELIIELEASGELPGFRHRLTPRLEVTEITDRISKSHSVALSWLRRSRRERMDNRAQRARSLPSPAAAAAQGGSPWCTCGMSPLGW